MTQATKVLLCVLDGFGHGKKYKGNAIARAKTPFINKLKKEYPWTLLSTSGEAVGIPAGNQGGSEVGHFTIGAGRTVAQPLLEINTAIKNKTFFKKKELLKAIKHVKKHKSALHIMGMISDEGVHSNINHGLALLELAKRNKVQQVYFHAITDGRDVPPQSAQKYIKMITKKIKELGMENSASIATIIGRYYAMDRDTNWSRTQQAFDLLTKAKGRKAKDPLTAIDYAYAHGAESDYYLKPIIINPAGIMKKEDAVIFFNFRTDRSKQLTEMLLKKLKPYFVAFGPYTKKAPVVFPAPVVKNNLAQVLAKKHKKQLRIAETEKYAHVTFFFNSQIKEPVRGEKRILVDSPKCPSYAQQPEMSAPEVTKKLLKEIAKGHTAQGYDFIALNFANPDLVGHSGDIPATIKAIQVLDDCLSQIVPKALAEGYDIMITADHGNAEFMLYPNGSKSASHSTNPVPFILITPDHKQLRRSSHARATAGLKDIAPTILKLMRIRKPWQMKGESLV